MIKNIPCPFTYPVHGVSNDPEFYKVDEKKASEGFIHCKFQSSFPFGYKWGYETNCGVISTGCDQVTLLMEGNSNKKLKRREKLR